MTGNEIFVFCLETNKLSTTNLMEYFQKIGCSFFPVVVAAAAEYIFNVLSFLRSVCVIVLLSLFKRIQKKPTPLK